MRRSSSQRASDPTLLTASGARVRTRCVSTYPRPQRSTSLTRGSVTIHVAAHQVVETIAELGMLTGLVPVLAFEEPQALALRRWSQSYHGSVSPT